MQPPTPTRSPLRPTATLGARLVGGLLACASVLALAACDNGGVRISSSDASHGARGVLKVIDALQCPDTLGSLTRKGSAQADGTVCTYTGPRGAEVSLHLVTLGDEGATPVLKAFEDRLMADMPSTAGQLTQAHREADQAAADAARTEADIARVSADSARVEAGEAAVQARAAADASRTAQVRAPGVNIRTEGDNASVRLPGIHVETNDGGADVRIGGLTIHSDDGAGARAQAASRPSLHGQLQTGQETVSIQAQNDVAEIRSTAPGDAVRATYLLTDGARSNTGWRMVGYEARGPRGGPIVVATVRSREQHGDDVFDDAKALVTLNVGE